MYITSGLILIEMPVIGSNSFSQSFCRNVLYIVCDITRRILGHLRSSEVIWYIEATAQIMLLIYILY